MTPKQFMQRWKAGIMSQTQARLAYNESIGHLWGIIGLLLANFYMCSKGMWYWAIFLLAMTYVEYVVYIRTRQKYEQLKRFEDELMKKVEGEMDEQSYI